MHARGERGARALDGALRVAVDDGRRAAVAHAHEVSRLQPVRKRVAVDVRAHAQPPPVLAREGHGDHRWRRRHVHAEPRCAATSDTRTTLVETRPSTPRARARAAARRTRRSR